MHLLGPCKRRVFPATLSKASTGVNFLKLNSPGVGNWGSTSLYMYDRGWLDHARRQGLSVAQRKRQPERLLQRIRAPDPLIN